MKYLALIILLNLTGLDQVLAQDRVAKPTSWKAHDFRANKSYRIKLSPDPKDILRIQELPEIKLNTEPEVSTRQILKELGVPEKPRSATLRETRELSNLGRLREKPATPAAPFTTKEPSLDKKLLAIRSFENVPFPQLKESNPNALAVTQVTDDDIKLIEALIVLDFHRNYPLALGQAALVLNRTKSHKPQAQFLVGKISHLLSLNSEAREHLKQIAKKPGTWQLPALEILSENITTEDLELAEFMEPFMKTNDVTESKLGPYYIARAKSYIEKQDLTQALAHLDMIEKQSLYFLEAQYLKALILYRGNKIDESYALLQETLPQIEKSRGRWDVKSLAAITLARIQFQKGHYKEAFQTYLKIEKNHPLWLQSLIEAAWTQILIQDYEGAAGNMFSLHTDFFKNAYQPESYILRTVSYLNLCQYGDSLHVLKDFKRKYNYAHNRIVEYQKAHKNEADYYETVRTWLKNQELREVDTLPRSLIVEMARDPKFIKRQREINTLEDETSAFFEITKKLLDFEKTLQAKIQATKTDIAKSEEKLSKTKSAEGQKPIQEHLQKLERQLQSYQIQAQIAFDSRQSLRSLRTAATSRIETEKAQLKAETSKQLKLNLAATLKSLDDLIAQSDLLQYEIFSGAGEHLRYQMAGGEAQEKPKVQEKKNDQTVTWGFKGEIWEDEVGHFRSSLKNVCAKDE